MPSIPIPRTSVADPDSTLRILPHALRGAAAALLSFLLSGCGGSPPDDLGSLESGLAPCPTSPNCVHTGDRHPEGTAPLLLSDEWTDRSPEALAAAVSDALEALPRTRIVRSEFGEGFFLHAESTSRIFRFVDDVEVLARAEATELMVRSASRMGESDMGVNGERVDTLRGLLVERGMVLP